VRELTDANGNVRARYAYDPYGRRSAVSGDMEADLGFGGTFWCSEAGLALARFRAYDPEPGRWLSRDPLKDAEAEQGPNLYAYAGNNPINVVDPLGLCCEKEKQALDAATDRAQKACDETQAHVKKRCVEIFNSEKWSEALQDCAAAIAVGQAACNNYFVPVRQLGNAWRACLHRKCHGNPKCEDQGPHSCGDWIHFYLGNSVSISTIEGPRDCHY
jgi:RHS repeat-associated protein